MPLKRLTDGLSLKLKTTTKSRSLLLPLQYFREEPHENIPPLSSFSWRCAGTFDAFIHVGTLG
jgi:hypothetical protein